MRFRSSFTCAGKTTSSSITALGAASFSSGAFAPWPAPTGSAPIERKALSIAFDTCACFFWSALAKANITTNNPNSNVMKSA